MPLYDVMCPRCGNQREIYRSLADYQDTPKCCGEPMQRVITAPMIMGDIEPYRSMIDGSMINSRSRHKEHLRDHGCLEVGNETLVAKKVEPPAGLKETLIRVTNEKLH